MAMSSSSAIDLLRVYRRSYPNVLLIIDPSPIFIYLLMAFYRYANVYPLFWSIGKYHRLVHGAHVLKPIRSRASPTNLAIFSHIFNPRHSVRALSIPPSVGANSIDLVFVSDPVICRLDLRVFRNAVKAYWAQDCIYDKTKYIQLAGGLDSYDYIFVAHKGCMSEYREVTGARVEWLPFAFSPDIFRPRDTRETFDLSFIGGLDGIGAYKRKRVFDLIRRERPSLRIYYGSGFWGHHLSLIYNMSKIVLNISRVGEMNWRDFEALGSGGLFLETIAMRSRRSLERGFISYSIETISILLIRSICFSITKSSGDL